MNLPVDHHIKEQLKQNHLIVGVSGGMDSMTLLYWLRRLHNNITVVHINYHRRGEFSDKEQQLVEDFCTILQLPIRVFHFPTEKPSGNFQEQARNFRFDKFKEVHAEFACARIILAHHADDQVETFLFNLLRGGGLMGLSAMPMIHEEVIRPFLPISKQEILNYATFHGIPWLDDQSNFENDYQRNRIRNVLLPALTNSLPHFSASVLTLVDCFQKNQFALSKQVNDWRNSNDWSQAFLQACDPFFQFEFWRQLEQPASSFTNFQRFIHSSWGSKLILNNHSELLNHKGTFIVPAIKKSPEFEMKITRLEKRPDAFDKSSLYLNADVDTSKLNVRNWKKGDRIAYLGGKGTQLISDIMKDAGMNQAERKAVPVLTYDNEIIWLVGIKIGRKLLAEAQLPCLQITVQIKN